MKFIKISLIFILAFGSFLFSNTIWAYCVYNDSSIRVIAFDTRYSIFKKYWMDNHMNPGDYSCCPGGKPECKHAKIDVYSFPGEYPPVCPGDNPVAYNGWIDVQGDSHQLTCIIHGGSGSAAFAMNNQSTMQNKFTL